MAMPLDILSDWIGLAITLPIITLALFAAFERRLLRTYWRVILRAGPLLPIIAAVIVWGWTTTVSADDGLRPAIIAAIVVATGWFVTFFFQEFRKEDARADDQEDLLLALRAEIWIYLWTLRRGDTIVQFYAALSDARRFVEEMQSDRFIRLPLQRRRKAYRDYMSMRLQLEDSADDAVATINRFLRVGDGTGAPNGSDKERSSSAEDVSARKANLRNWINNQAAGPSAQSAHADFSGRRP